MLVNTEQLKVDVWEQKALQRIVTQPCGRMERITDSIFSLGGQWGWDGQNTQPAPPARQQGWPTQETDSFDKDFSLISKEMQTETQVPPPHVQFDLFQSNEHNNTLPPSQPYQDGPQDPPLGYVSGLFPPYGAVTGQTPGQGQPGGAGQAKHMTQIATY